MRIVVVGATGTIGKAVADALSSGHEVLRASRKGEITVDIDDPASIKSMYASLGKVDAVVSCAGNADFAPVDKVSDAQIQHTLASKLVGQMNLVRFGIDHVNDGGIFVLTAGIFSQKPMPGASTIAAVNGALESFARGAALELPRKLRIVTVSPPFIHETARAMGMPGGDISAADNATFYVSAVEDGATGSVIFPK